METNQSEMARPPIVRYNIGAEDLRFFSENRISDNAVLNAAIISPNFTKFSIHVTFAVARFSSDGNAICYLFPVLCMTSCFHIIKRMVQKQRRRLFCRVRQVAALERSLPSPTASFVLTLLSIRRSIVVIHGYV